MNIEFINKDNFTLIKIEGRLDAKYSDLLKEQFQKNLSKSKNFIFDLGKMDFIDSTGLGSLVNCLKKATQNSGTLLIVNILPKARMVFEITRAYTIFDIYDSVEQAVNSL